MVSVPSETPEDLLRKLFGEEVPTEPEPPRNNTPVFQLALLMPEFAAEVVRVLTACGEAALARQIAELWVFDRCRCGQQECATIHTAADHTFKYGRGVGDANDTTLMAIDISSDGRIVSIETLGYPGFPQRLTKLMPL
jgi:hypothetical protein